MNAVRHGLWSEDGQTEGAIASLAKKELPAVSGTAVFLTSEVEGAPTALLNSLKYYKVLHEKNGILSDDEKVFFESFCRGFSRAIVTFGYMQTPNIPKALILARKFGWKFDHVKIILPLATHTHRLCKRRHAFPAE